MRSFLAFAALLVSAPVAQAEGLHYSGDLTFEHFSLSQSGHTLSGKANLGYSLPVGPVEVGVETTADIYEGTHQGENPLYTVLTVGGTFGKISVGKPLIAADDYLTSPASFGIETTVYEVEFLPTDLFSVLLRFNDYDFSGIRYDTPEGATEAGIGFYKIEGVNLVSGGLRHSFGDVAKVEMTYSKLDDPRSKRRLGSLNIGGSYRFGKTTVSVQEGDLEFLVGTIRTVRLRVAQQIGDRLTITPELVSSRYLGDSFHAQGLSARYVLTDHLALTGGYFDGTGNFGGAALGLNLTF